MPDTTLPLKPVQFLGSSRQALREMPASVRQAIGGQLMRLQLGRIPTNFKPLHSVGPGACEIRVQDGGGAFRAVYVTRFTEAIWVLHVFQKKSQKTAKQDLALARQRYKLLPRVKT